MDSIKILPLNETYVKIQCERSTAYALGEHFSFKVPGAHFSPQYKARVWDGKIRLFNLRNNTILKGLWPEVERYASENGLEARVDESLICTGDFTLDHAKALMASLSLPEWIEERDYQLETVTHAINNQRALFLSSTSSGKSLVIYMLIRYFGMKTLILVDSLNLLHQLYSDFQDYGFDSDKHIHKLYADQDKITDKNIIISTWQSAARMPKEWFDDFTVLIGDEAHRYKSKELTRIMSNLERCPIRIGLTGTLDGAVCNKMVIEGHFGPTQNIISARELIERGEAAKLNLSCLMIKHPEAERKRMQRAAYADEVAYLLTSEKRNKIIKSLALNLEGNTLVMFKQIEHGKLLKDMIEAEAQCPVFYVSGEIKGEKREDLRQQIINSKKSITIASVVFATGVNIPTLNNIVFTHPTKAQINLLQTIGRGLRLADGKVECKFFDMSDDLSWKKWTNFTMKHFMNRLEIYGREKHDYKLIKMNL